MTDKMQKGKDAEDLAAAFLKSLGYEIVQHVEEAADVGLIQRSVQLIQHAEGAGLHHVDGKEQGHRRHAALTTGEQADGL